MSGSSWLDENGKFHLKIMIADLPARPNELLGRSKFLSRSNAKKWKSRMYQEAKSLAPKAPLKKAKIKCTRYGTRFMDYDGLVGSFKPVIDGLTPIKQKMPKGLKGYGREIVRSSLAIIWPGVLSDDSWTVTGPWIVSQELVKKGQERIEIEISER